MIYIAACFVGWLDEDGGQDMLEQIHEYSGVPVIGAQSNNNSRNLISNKTSANLAGYKNFEFISVMSAEQIMSVGLYTVVFSYNGVTFTSTVPGMIVDQNGNIKIDSSKRNEMFEYFYKNDPNFKAYVDKRYGL